MSEVSCLDKKITKLPPVPVICHIYPPALCTHPSAPSFMPRDPNAIPRPISDHSTTRFFQTGSTGDSRLKRRRYVNVVSS